MLLQSLLALAFVLGLFALIVWGVRRFQGFAGNSVKRDFKIIQRIHLDNKHSIIEISHQQRRYLLGLSPGGMIQLRSADALPANDTAQTKEPTVESHSS